MLVNFLALLFNLNLANGMAIIASVATIRMHQETKLLCRGSLMSWASELENRMSIMDNTAELAKMEMSAVE